MGLIKANNLASSAATFNLADIEQQARAMILRAKAQGDQILAEATRQAAELKAAVTKGLESARLVAIEEGKKLGREQGIAQALPQAKAQALAEQKAVLTNAIAGLGDVSMQLDAKMQSFEAAAKADLLKLSVEIARRVVKVISERDVVVLERNVAECVRLVVDKSAVRIAVAPSQLEQLNALLPQLKLTWPTLRSVEMTADDTLRPGGCRVFSASGSIDANIASQLERIASELLASGENSEPTPSSPGVQPDNEPNAQQNDESKPE